MYLRFDGRRLNRSATNSGTAVSVGEVVDRVGEQPDGTCEDHDRHLHKRGHHQRDERHPDCVHATLARFERVVDRVGGVVAVRTEDLGEGTPETARMVVVGMVVVAVVMIVVVMVVMVVRHALRLLA